MVKRVYLRQLKQFNAKIILDDIKNILLNPSNPNIIYSAQYDAKDSKYAKFILNLENFKKSTQLEELSLKVIVYTSENSNSIFTHNSIKIHNIKNIETKTNENEIEVSHGQYLLTLGEKGFSYYLQGQ